MMKVKYMLFLMAFWAAIPSQAQLKLPQVFGDHMVIQRDQPVRFWGLGAPNEEVQCSIDEITVSTKADNTGTWELLFPSHVAGGPFIVTIKTENESIEYSDVYFGEVWVASGQSNMEWQLNWKINNWEKEVEDSDYPQIRFIKVKNSYNLNPQWDIETEGWKVSNQQNSPDFSAVAWFFAKHNHLDKNVPVGIINTTWGGTPAEAWTSAEALKAVPGYSQAAQDMLNPGIDWASKKLANEKADEKKWELIGDTVSFKSLGAQNPEFDDSSWEEVSLPNPGYLEGFVWFRKEFEARDGNAQLYLGDVDQLCWVYMNGQLIDSEWWQDTTGVIDLKKGILNKGTNTIAVRAVNSWNNQVRMGRKGEMWLKQGKKKISLEGSWKYDNTIEPEMPKVEFFHWRPGLIYNSMIAPIAGYSIKGSIWYQGESNADKPELYAELFKTMIRDWRIRWKQGNFPFLFVQLASFMERKPASVESGWAELRKAQEDALVLPKTGMAVTIDIGDARDIHPRNKQDVGLRLWLQAKAVAYGEDKNPSGPTIQRAQIVDEKVVLTFDFNNSLVLKEGEITGFAVAGVDESFEWVEADIVNNKVVLSVNGIDEPVYVSYAWGDNPPCSLMDQEGLPGVPFKIKIE